MKFLLTALLAVVLFAAYAYSQDLEGAYEWTLGGTEWMYICEEDNRIHGMYGQMGIFTARMTNIAVDNTSSIVGYGRYYGPGWRFGGERLSRRNWERNQGHVILYWDSSSEELTINFYVRTELDLTMQFVGTRANATVDNRVWNCAIFNNTAEDWVMGQWEAEGSTYHFDLCVDGADFTGSYHYNNTGLGEIAYGYTVGKCYQNGQVCSSDWYEGEYFGNEMYVQLWDGTLMNSYWNGPDTSNVTTHGLDLYERVSETASNCSANSFNLYDPLKCQTFDNEFCLSQAQFGFCVLNEEKINSNGNSCFKTKWESS